MVDCGTDRLGEGRYQDVLRLALGALALAWTAGTPIRAAAQHCPGDCSANGEVTIDELVRAVTIALGEAPVAGCSNADPDGDGSVVIGELVGAVNSGRSAATTCMSSFPTCST